MGLKSGDKSRYFRMRKKRNLRRVEMRAFRKELTEKAASAKPAQEGSAGS